MPLEPESPSLGSASLCITDFVLKLSLPSASYTVNRLKNPGGKKSSSFPTAPREVQNYTSFMQFWSCAYFRTHCDQQDGILQVPDLVMDSLLGLRVGLAPSRTTKTEGRRGAISGGKLQCYFQKKKKWTWSNCNSASEHLGNTKQSKMSITWALLGRRTGIKEERQLGVIIWKILNARLTSSFLFDGLEQGSANTFYKR